MTSSGFIELHPAGFDRAQVYVAIDKIVFFYSKWNTNLDKTVTRIVFGANFGEDFVETSDEVKAKLAKALSGEGHEEEEDPA